MKNTQISMFSIISSVVLTKSQDGAEVGLVPRHSTFLYVQLLIGALIALATFGNPVAAQAQKELKKQAAFRDDGSAKDLQIETSRKGETIRRAADDFKLDGSDEPEFPPASARLSRGSLHVQGTQSRDLIEIEISGTSVEVWISDNANPLAPLVIFSDTFHINDVEELRVFGLAGKDVIINNTSIPDFIWGGLGNDDILAGDGVSHLFGQDGDDILNGNGGNDCLWGAGGGDYLFGGPGSDFISGDEGVDWVSGGDSYGGSDDDIDQLVGGAGGDVFTVAPENLAEDILFDYDPAEGDVTTE